MRIRHAGLTRGWTLRATNCCNSLREQELTILNTCPRLGDGKWTYFVQKTSGVFHSVIDYILLDAVSLGRARRFAVHDEETADFGSDHRLLTVDMLMAEDVCRATEPIAAVCVASAGQLPLHLRWSLANVDWGAFTVKLRREMADWQRIATPLVDLLPERPRLCDQHGEAGALAQEPAETQVVIDFLERSFKHSLFAAALAVVPVARRSPHAVSWVNDAVRNALRVREALKEQRRAWRLMLCHEQGGKRKLKEQRKKRKEMDAPQDQGQQAQPSGAAGALGKCRQQRPVQSVPGPPQKQSAAGIGNASQQQQQQVLPQYADHFLAASKQVKRACRAAKREAERKQFANAERQLRRLLSC